MPDPIHPALTIKCEDCKSAIGEECTKGRQNNQVRTFKRVPCSRRKRDALKAGAVWAPDDRRRAAQSDAVRDAQRAGRYASPPAFPVPDAATLALIQERGWTLEEFNARKATAVRRISLRQV
jgi:hypothetical protein